MRSALAVTRDETESVIARGSVHPMMPTTRGSSEKYGACVEVYDVAPLRFAANPRTVRIRRCAASAGVVQSIANVAPDDPSV